VADGSGPREPHRARARWRAPGRVNLIGEHTDYNQGLVLPFAIDAACTATVRGLDRPVLRISSAQRPEPVTLDFVDELATGRFGSAARGDTSWSSYVVGVFRALSDRVGWIGGADVEVDSTVPPGSGLSSSAALVCSVATAADDAFGLGLSADDLLAVTRSAENDYVGAPTGGMDQLAALRCTADHVLFCDMRTLATEQVAFDPAASGLTVVVIDSHAEHRHADGEYRVRREGCERAAALLGVRALRDVAVDDLPAALDRLPDDELRRYTRHIVTEDDRVLRTVELLRAGRVGDIGELLTRSHASMRDDYRITIAELDLAADTLVAEGAIGARMTGGGFGGCVIGLIATDRADDAAGAVARAYAARGYRPPTHFTARPAAGAHRVREQ
jgi:galactokinase